MKRTIAVLTCIGAVLAAAPAASAQSPEFCNPPVGRECQAPQVDQAQPTQTVQIPAVKTKKAKRKKGKASLAAASSAPAAAAKKKKKKAKNLASTRSSLSAFASSTSASVQASCVGKTHVTGGGFAVSPSFTPPSTGVRSMNVTSNPSGAKTWTGGGSAYVSPAASGGFTAYARCEKNSAGQIAITGTSTLPISAAAGQNMVFNCPPGTHVISGGYSGTGLATFALNIQSHRIVVLQNRRTGPAQWTISAYNNPNQVNSASLTGYAMCEINGKGKAVSEASSFVPLVDNGRTVGDATCGGKTHMVSGGFLVSPATFPGSVPLVAIDENLPVGKKGWHVGLWEYPVGLPPGSALQTTAYCKKG